MKILPNLQTPSPVWMVVIGVLLWSMGGLFIKWTSISGYEVNLGRCFFAAITIALLTRFKALKADKFTLLASLATAEVEEDAKDDDGLDRMSM